MPHYPVPIASFDEVYKTSCSASSACGSYPSGQTGSPNQYLVRSFAANAARVQLHALAYNLGNFLRTLATPEPIQDWSLTNQKEKLIKIGAKVVSHGRYVSSRWPRSPSHGKCSKRFWGSSRSYGRSHHRETFSMSCIQEQPTEGVRPNARENGRIRPSTKHSDYPRCW